MDVALASCVTLPEPDPDAEPLLTALAAAGIDAGVRAWDDPAVDWAAARATVLRPTWDYPLDPDGFLAWAERAAHRSALWNPLPVVRWNLHKRYLTELEARGLAVAPTVVVERGSNVSLREIVRSRGWDDVVVKPAISAASYRTLRLRRGEIESGEKHLRELLRDRDVLVQRYLPAVESYGERALVWIDGELTHAVRKEPRFAGQDESVSSTAVEVAPAEAELARRVIAAAPGPLLYARVDVAPGEDGRPTLMELELIEPSLFLVQHRPALDRFVAAIGRRVREASPA